MKGLYFQTVKVPKVYIFTKIYSEAFIYFISIKNESSASATYKVLVSKKLKITKKSYIEYLDKNNYVKNIVFV